MTSFRVPFNPSKKFSHPPPVPYLVRMEKEEESIVCCLNCQAELPVSARYCPSCRQRVRDGFPTIWEFIKNGFFDLINFDSRLIRTLRDLMIPGKMTRAWFAGQRQCYLPPVRVALTTGVFVLAAAAFMIPEKDFMGFGEQADYEKAMLAQLEIYTEVDTLTTNLKEELSDPEERAVVDTLRDRIGVSDDYSYFDQDIYVPHLDGLSVTSNKNLVMKRSEIFSDISADSLIRKYEIEGFWNGLLAKQNIRLRRSGEDFGMYMLGSALWVVLLMIPLGALLLKLLYLRRGVYLIQHFVFLLHLNALILVLASLMILLGHLAPGLVIGGGFLLIVVLTYVAMLRVYGQHWFKTLVKFVLAGLVYLCLFIPLALVTVAIVRVAMY